MNLRRVLRAASVAASCLAAMLVSSGCETTQLFQGDPDKATPGRSDWQASEPLDAESFQDVWDRTEATLEIMNFDVDADHTHYEDRTIVTKWMTHLAPFRLQGFRRRAHVEILPEGTKWVIRAAVLLQRNADIDNPTSPAQAQWETMGTDASRTALLVYRISSAFDPEQGGVLSTPDEKQPSK